MCESFERLAKKYANQIANQMAEERAVRAEVKTKVSMVKALMKNMKCTLEEALNVFEIKGNERAVIAKQLQKQ